MAFSARILADSINRVGNRLITFEATFPRFILAEVNTHRVLSRNSASSRAIPVKKQLERLKNDPFIPLFWGKNQKGMQASVELSPEEKVWAIKCWLEARDSAIKFAEILGDPEGLDVHKQTTNRLLETFMWHTAIISGTDRENLYNLRDSAQAQPEFCKIIQMMRALERESTPKLLIEGEWHLPLTDDILELRKVYSEEQIARISCARCARVSYLTHDGIRDPGIDLEMADKLQIPGHMSPFEHAAQAYASQRRSGNFVGFAQYRKRLPNEAIFLANDPFDLSQPNK